MRRRGVRGPGRGGVWSGPYQDRDEGEETTLYLGDDADGEKLAKRLGTETMSKLAEGFEEMGDWVLPSLLEDAYLDALTRIIRIETVMVVMVEEGTTKRRERKDNGWVGVWESIGCHG